MCSHPSLPQGRTADWWFPFWFTRTLRSFSAKLLPCQSVPTPYIRIGLFQMGCVSLWNVRRLLSDRSSSLLRSLWTTALPSSILTTSLVPSTELLRAYSVPLFRSLMKAFSNIGISVSPSETLLETGHQLDCVPLVTILWVKDPVNFQPALPTFLVSVSSVWPCDLKKRSVSQIRDSYSSALLLPPSKPVRKSLLVQVYEKGNSREIIPFLVMLQAWLWVLQIEHVHHGHHTVWLRARSRIFIRGPNSAAQVCGHAHPSLISLFLGEC